MPIQSHTEQASAPSSQDAAEKAAPKMTTIHFTQFMRPNGRPVEVSIDLPAPIGAIVERLIHRGYGFECEHLMTGHVSFTIVDEHGDQDIEVVPNGPEVPLAISRMIERFAKRIAA